MQDFVHLVPMFLCTCTKEINRGEVDGTLHGPEFVVDVLWLHPHNFPVPRSLPYWLFKFATPILLQVFLAGVI